MGHEKAISNTPHLNADTAADLFSGFVSQSPVWFDSNSGVVSVNTQARRLGCLIYLLGQVTRGRRIESLLVSPSAQEVAALKRNLVGNAFTSGYLTKRPSSVQHYLDAAVELHLLVRQGALFHLTGRGQFLLEAIRPDVDAPYPLTRHSKVFFLHTLLAVDYFGMAAIARSLLQGVCRLSTIQRDHQPQLLHMLEGVSRGAANARLQRLAQDRLISIRQWKKPESYAEHLVSAKLNWLADLGILEAAPSANSNILVKKEHEQWLNVFSRAETPTDAQLLSLALQYSAVRSGVEPLVEGQVCTALNSAFQRLAGPGTLVKIRCTDFVLFLLCFHGPMLVTFITEGKRLLEDSTIECGEVIYKVHVASRPTQSFIVRQERRAK